MDCGWKRYLAIGERRIRCSRRRPGKRCDLQYRWILRIRVHHCLGVDEGKRGRTLTKPPRAPPQSANEGAPQEFAQSSPPSRPSDIVLTEIAKLQNDGDYTKRDLGEMRTDMRDMRDRMSKLEVRVDHLPSKEFIVTVVMISLTLVGGLLTVAPKLQSWAGTAPNTTSAPPATVAH